MYRSEHSAQVTIHYLAGDRETLQLHPSAADELTDAVRAGDVCEFETDDGQFRVIRGECLVGVTVPAVRSWWELAIAVADLQAWLDLGIFDGTESDQPQPTRDTLPAHAAAYPMALYFRGVASRRPLTFGPIMDSLEENGIDHKVTNIGAEYPFTKAVAVAAALPA